MSFWGEIAKNSKPEAKAEEKEKFEDFFKPLSEVLPRKKLKIGIWGDTETGKTHFALSCPPPVYVIDTEYGAPLVAKKFKKEIYIMECFVEDPETMKADPVKSLERVEKAINLLRSKNLKEGTIVIDSGTDIWQWEEERMKEQVGEMGRKLFQFDWGIANKHYKELMMKLLSMETVFVITAQPREIYVGAQKTGLFQPKWMQQTPFWLDVVLHTEKLPPTPDYPRAKYVATITKCRAERQFDKQIEDVTYDKLYEVLRPYLE